jgi:Cu-Zn family superoxide dismutase
MKTFWQATLGLVVCSIASLACASIVIPVYLTNDSGQGKEIGTVIADNTIYGLLLTPKLHDLPPGAHGFHIHAMAMCDHYGMGAGGHLDPKQTNKHLGPYSGNGHLGDLPILYVGSKGDATTPVLAPRLKLEEIEGKALMIHAGGDNYSDNPKLGGGGARIACGIIPNH